MTRPEQSEPATFEVEVAADQTIADCGGDAREAVKALLVANGFLEAQVAELRASVSAGYSRGSTSRAIGRIGTTEMAEVTYYVVSPFVAADDGIAAGGATECFSANAAVMRAEALSRKPGILGRSRSAVAAILRPASSETR